MTDADDAMEEVPDERANLAAFMLGRQQIDDDDSASSVEINTDLTEDAVSATLDAVNSHAYGRTTTSTDGHLVRLLLRSGIAPEAIIQLLCSQLTTETQVEACTLVARGRPSPIERAC